MVNLKSLGKGFKVRQGTTDEEMYIEVYRTNVYGLTDKFSADDVIIDLGGHIGSFVYTAVEKYGASKIYSYEPDPDNFSILTENSKKYQQVKIYNLAVWRSDIKEESIQFSGYHYETSTRTNTACGSVIKKEDLPFCSVKPFIVKCVPFDDVMEECTERGNKRVKFLKSDCEGSEYPILYTSSYLHLIDYIALEYHDSSDFINKDGEIFRYKAEDLIRFLNKKGFDLVFRGHEYFRGKQRVGCLRFARRQ